MLRDNISAISVRAKHEVHRNKWHLVERHLRGLLHLKLHRKKRNCFMRGSNSLTFLLEEILIWRLGRFTGFSVFTSINSEEIQKIDTAAG